MPGQHCRPIQSLRFWRSHPVAEWACGSYRAEWWCLRKWSRSNQDPLIAIVEQKELENSFAIGTNYVCVVLRVEPVLGISAILKREITLVAKFPENVACSLPIIVVNLQHPTLMPHGDD